MIYDFWNVANNNVADRHCAPITIICISCDSECRQRQIHQVALHSTKRNGNLLRILMYNTMDDIVADGEHLPREADAALPMIQSHLTRKKLDKGMSIKYTHAIDRYTAHK